MLGSSSCLCSNPFLSPPRPPSRRTRNFEADNWLPENRYEILGELGRGQYGVVYRARDKIRNLDVALKAARTESCEPQHAHRILQHELCMNSLVSGHANIVQVYDLHYTPGCPEGTLLMAMELVEGISLRRWLRDLAGRQNVRIDNGIPMMIQVCEGLIALHHAGVVHLDLKPENILINRDGVLKISDLGAAQYLHALHLTASCRYEELLHGTPAYMSPEQFVASDPRDIGVESDIYSLGAIMHETFSDNCRPPFAGTYEELREQHLRSAPPPLHNVSPELATIVARCLAKSVSRRSSAKLIHQQASDGLAGQFSRGSAPRTFSYVLSRPSGRNGNGSV